MRRGLDVVLPRTEGITYSVFPAQDCREGQRDCQPGKSAGAHDTKVSCGC